MFFDKEKIIEEVKETLLIELQQDAHFKQQFLNALGVKEDVILLNGNDIKIEVVRK